MLFWRKKRIFRRFTEAEPINGYSSSDYDDVVILADVQTVSKKNSTEEDGDDSLQKVKAFTDEEIRTADVEKGILADNLWFQGKWFECQSSVLSENTILKHYTSEFVQCLNQNEPPDEEGLLCN